MKHSIIYKFLSLLFLILAGAHMLPAQDTDAATNTAMGTNQMMMMVLIIGIIMAIVCLILVITIYYMVYIKPKVATDSTGEESLSTEGTTQLARTKSIPLFRKISYALTRAVPIDKEASVDLGHDYDGIRELDNALPPWWKYGFYITIFLSVIYVYYYHLSGNDWSSKREYELAMEEAEVAKAAYLSKLASNVDETNVAIQSDGEALALGKSIYETNCVACHGVEGQGGVGPNFTDEYWIHGGSVKDVFATIKYGVPEKGMISWKEQLRPTEMQAVSSYILTQFPGTNPPDGKEPQGELYVPEALPADSIATDSVDVISMK